MIAKLDGELYAIKEIPVKTADNAEVVKEVKLLSRLNHKNVVRYFNAWQEITPEEGESEGATTSLAGPSLPGQLRQYLYIQMELCGKQTLRDCIDSYCRPSLGV